MTKSCAYGLLLCGRGSIHFLVFLWGIACLYASLVSSVSDVLQPETLVKVMKKLTLNPGLKRSVRRRTLRDRIAAVPVENTSEKIRREVQSAFPKRRVRTLLSVLKDPIAKMRRFVRVSFVCGLGC